MPPAKVSVTVKTIPKVRTLALRLAVDTYGAQHQQWQRVLEFASANQIQRQAESECFAAFYDPEYTGRGMTTELYLPIADDAVIPADIKEFTVGYSPEIARAACVIHKGSYADLKAIYSSVCMWACHNDEVVSGCVRAIYHVGVEHHSGDDSQLVTEIVVPLLA